MQLASVSRKVVAIGVVSVVLLVLAAMLATWGEGSPTPLERAILIAAIVCIPAAAIGAGLSLARRISRGLTDLEAANREVANGNLDIEMAVTSRDELGRVSASFNASLVELRRIRDLQHAELRRTDDLQTTLAEFGQFAEQIANGNLTARVDATEDDEQVAGLAANLNEMARGLDGLSGQVRVATTQMAGATSQILAVVSQHSAATSEQAASVAQTSVTIDEVRASARQVAERATDLAAQADGMMEVSAEGSDAVDGIVSGMALIRDRVEQIARDILSLSERTKAIESITQSVNDLADQSNMLALNATIEAARAGEQGKGFAVVAQEVRALAEQSKAATGQVREILGEIQQATAAAVLATEEGSKAVEEGVGRAHRAGGAIDRMEANIKETAQFATAIAASVREQHVGMDQIAQAMADISSSSAQMATGAGDTEEAAGLLAGLAGRLEDLTGRYRVSAEHLADTSEVVREPDPAVESVSFDDLAFRAADKLGVECGVVGRFADGMVIPVGTYLPDGHVLSPFAPEGSGAFATVFRTGAPARVHDYDALDSDKVARVARAGAYRSSVCVPVHVHGQLWGAVLVATRERASIPRGAETVLTRIARDAAALAGALVPAR